jgi:SP family general alpha glucoside:H+ symporter-like MFS transporter
MLQVANQIHPLSLVPTSIIIGIICSVLTPYMLNPGAWNWRNFAGFFWGGACFLCIIYTYFRVPEPMGRSFAELDLLFEKGVSARKFSSTKVNVFAEDFDMDTMDNYYRQLGEDNLRNKRAEA